MKDKLNPYKTPSTGDKVRKRPPSRQTRNVRRLLANVSLAISIGFLAIGWGIGIWLVQVGWWDAFDPDGHLNRAFDWIAAGFLLVGFVACFVSIAAGTWVHRAIGVSLTLLYWPLVKSVAIGVLTNVRRLL